MWRCNNDDVIKGLIFGRRWCSMAAVNKNKNWLIQSRIFLKGSLDSLPSPSLSVKIQIMGGKVCLRCKGETLLGDVNKLFVFKSLLTTPSNVLPIHLKQTFPPIIWISNDIEGDVIKFSLPYKIFSTLTNLE